MPTTYTDLAEKLHALARRCPELRDEIEDLLGLVIELEDTDRVKDSMIEAGCRSIHSLVGKRCNDLIRLREVEARLRVRMCEPSRS